MQSKATTVEAYLEELAPVRRKVLEAVRGAILAHIDRDCEESMQYGMISYCVPHRVYPKGYHCDPKLPVPYAALAAQKGHFSLYLMSVYGDPEIEAWLRRAWASTGRKLDMGKACIRFKKLEDLPLELIGELLRRTPVADYLARYEQQLAQPRPSAGQDPNAAQPDADPAQPDADADSDD